MLNTKVKTVILGTIMFSILLNNKFPYIHIEKEKIKTVEINKDNNYIYQNVVIDKVSNKGYEDIQKSIISSLGEVKTEEKNLIIEPEWIDIRVSYYTISKRDTGKLDGITASGKNLKTLSRGGDVDIKNIATPNNIPFGTKLFVEGIGKCEAVDTGTAIQWHGNTMWIDVFVPHASQSELEQLGVKHTRGYILKE